MAPASVRALRKLSVERRQRVAGALTDLAERVGSGSRIGGKRVKTIRGARDAFHRLRIGDLRVMYDVIEADRVILVLGIVHRGDLERWIRGR